MPSRLHSRIAAYTPRRLHRPHATQAAVALVLAPARGIKKSRSRDILLIQRAIDPRDPWSGHIALPGGRREKNDADAIETAIRETKEETGLSLLRSELIGPLDDTEPKGPGLPKIVFRTFVFDLSRRRAVHPNAEVDRAFWVPLQDIAKGEKRVSINERGHIKRVPAYCIDSYIIWGATQRVLKRFLTLATS